MTTNKELKDNFDDWVKQFQKEIMLLKLENADLRNEMGRIKDYLSTFIDYSKSLRAYVKLKLP